MTGSDKELAQHLLTQENQGVSTLATTLEDGSVVLLAKETSLLYPKHFIADKREVSLQGNAFFDVAKKQGQPFWIDTEQAKIEVLGTAFSVQSDENAPFRLSVQRGIVKVTLKKRKSGVLCKSGGNGSSAITTISRFGYRITRMKSGGASLSIYDLKMNR